VVFRQCVRRAVEGRSPWRKVVLSELGVRTMTSRPSDSLSSHSDFEGRIAYLEAQVAAIQSRNQRVESHKAWETGRARLVSITVITYITMLLVFAVIGSARPYIDALVPTTGFFLSTLSLSFVRRFFDRS
jgi:hypothetical protein